MNASKTFMRQDAFENKFMSATESLYAAEGKQMVNELDVPIYLHHAEKRLRVRVMVEFLRGGVVFGVFFYIFCLS